MPTRSRRTKRTEGGNQGVEFSCYHGEGKEQGEGDLSQLPDWGPIGALPEWDVNGVGQRKVSQKTYTAVSKRPKGEGGRRGKLSKSYKVT